MTEKDFRYIDTAEQLSQLVAELSEKLAKKELVASYIDTEADSLHHYQEKLCLIQLAAGGIYALIDPLAIVDVSGLLAVLDQTTVWLHGMDYDLSMLKRTYAWTPQTVRDTQIAARLTGHRQFGLAALVQHFCGVTLNKSSQKADWSQRPLPPKMQAYAVDDVRYLAEISSTLMAELMAKGRVEWFYQSCESLRNDALNRSARDKDEAWRISGSGKLESKGLAILRAIWQWRDGMASERDSPPFRIMNNQQMLDMTDEIERTDRVSIPPRWRGKWRETLLAAVDQVRHSDPATWPQRPKKKGLRTSEGDRARIEQLCKARDQKAATLDIESSLLGSRAVLEDIILQPESETAAKLMGWQRTVLSEALAHRT